MEPFQCLSDVQIRCFQLLGDWRYIGFRTGQFSDFEHFMAGIYFANFGRAKIDPIWFILLSWTGHSYLTEFV